MINNIDAYLQQLRNALKDCDRATVQDALSDAEEYLRDAMETRLAAKTGDPQENIFAAVIEEYGSPSEIATAYQKIEARTSPSLAVRRQPAGKGNIFTRFFGVVTEPRAWGALLYLLFALVTGIIYFTWAVTGISLSFGLLILIIGIPVAGVFILSTRGIALLEGRMVEALLGIRMPHRPLFSNKDQGLWGKFKALVTDRHTWFSMVYMLLQLPLGIAYFTVFICLIAVSLALIFQPMLDLIFGIPAFTLGDSAYYLRGWVVPFAAVGGALIFVLTLHLAKVVGNLHGRFAKAMLVRE